MTRTGAFLVVLLLAGCSSTQTISGATTVAPETTAVTTEAGATTTAPSPAPPSTAAGSTTVPPNSTAPGGDCPGASGIPSGADIGTSITGDIDGDLVDDTITEYSLNGVPHVHSQLAAGGQSDTEVAIGFADHVQISFEDVDYAPAADVKPPVAVLAIGATKAGTAVYTFLTNTTEYCIQPWHTDDGQMWVGRLSSEGPYEGLLCEGAMGHRYYNVVSAESDGAGNVTVAQQPFHHNFTTIVFDAALPPQVVPDDANASAAYGDIYHCDHDPLFHPPGG
jgi:hypothetical protein